MPKLPPPPKRPWLPERKAQEGRKLQDGFYHTPAWRRLRNAFIKAYPLCAACEERGILKEGKVVDHTKPRRLYPALELDWNNLQTLCDSCHNSKSGKEGSKVYQKREERKAMFYIVYGAPGSGKTTYVLEKKAANDLVIDIDLIWQALTGMPMYSRNSLIEPYVYTAVDAIINDAVYATTAIDIWFITTNLSTPVVEKIKALSQHRIIPMNIDKQVCIDRINKDERRKDKQHHIRLINEWYSSKSGKEAHG